MKNSMDINQQSNSIFSSHNRHITDNMEVDERIANNLKSFIPCKVFDAHAHIYKLSDLHSKEQGSVYPIDRYCEGTIATWNMHLIKQIGKSRLHGGLLFPFPTADCNIDKCNRFLVEQLNKEAGRNCKGLILISPCKSPDIAAEYLKEKQIIGFKPYHFFSREKETFQSPISSYLPEWAWEVAHRDNLVIMLHLVRDKALSDPDNQQYIKEHCLKYPCAKLILAHAARGFHAPHTVNGLFALRGVENIWFDTSGICEPTAILSILWEFGPRRLLWGSDFPISENRGRCITIGEEFAWVNPDRVDEGNTVLRCRSTLIGLEALRALQEAAESFGLNEADLQDIFYGNAMRLFGYTDPLPDITGRLYADAKRRIPGGVQLLSKSPERMAPNQWPAYFREARGCETWDLDGRHYYDMSTNGIGACLLGFRDPDVTRAVQRRINLGSMCTLNPPEEVELAELLCAIHPWAEQVRFARTGGEATAVAVRIARAATGRAAIAICGYHGWHDWYLAANLGENDTLRGHLLPGLHPLGVPGELRGTALTFKYNRWDEFQSILDRYGSQLAAVIMEPCRHKDPEPGFLEFIREGARKHGALLIFDEITIGWRLHFGGAHLKLGVNPDIAVFAKALGNGHPIGAVIGTGGAMAAAERSFISSTYWTESVGPVAALTTLGKMQQVDVPGHVSGIGSGVAKAWCRYAAKHELPVAVQDHYPCLVSFRFEHEQAGELSTLYTQLMLERGFLAGCSLYPTLAHTEETVSLYAGAIDEAFELIHKALTDGDIGKYLNGPVAYTGFGRLL